MARGLLNDRVAIITGAGQGLGLAVSREFAEEGATVALVEINADTLNAAESELKAKGYHVLPYHLDITDHEAFRTAAADVAEKCGHIDILVNNAAIIRNGTILEDSIEDWRRQISVNLEAVYACTKSTVPYMVQQNSGRLINITSVQAFVSDGASAAYNAAKGGIIAFTKAMAVQLAPYNIAANAVAPGFMRTPLSVSKGIDETTTEEYITWYVEKRHVPMARTGFPEDVAGTVIFLASDYCRYMTGQVLVVDGGMTSTF